MHTTSIELATKILDSKGKRVLVSVSGDVCPDRADLLFPFHRAHPEYIVT